MQTIRIGHSPDPDDAFMFYALTAGQGEDPRRPRSSTCWRTSRSLNRRSRTGELEVTAVSSATYPLIARAVSDDGSRRVDGEGLWPDPGRPRADRPQPSSRTKVIAIPGKPHDRPRCSCVSTWAIPPIIEVAFDKIPQAVLEGQADLGLLIHEGQITYQTDGPHQGARPRRGVGSATRVCRCRSAST